MDQFTRDDLNSLIKATVPPCLSLYMPTYRAGKEVRQNAVRFRNLMKEAQAHLAELATEDQQTLAGAVASAARLADDGDFWQHQSDGLAMLLAPGRLWRYRVPMAFAERVEVGEHLYLRPLVRLLQGDGRFYILATSLKRVRLLAGTHYSVDELHPEGLPTNLADALNIDEYTSTLNLHAVSNARFPAAREVKFHGHGGAGLEVRKKDEIGQYFQRLAGALEAYIGQDGAPLVFAGVEYLFPIFREASRYKALVDQPLTGNPDEMSPAELQAEAWSVVQPRFEQHQESAVARFGNAAAGDAATSDLTSAAAAARRGLVDTMLVAEGDEAWGTIDEQGHATVSDRNSPGAQELLNYCTTHTLLHSGAVFSLRRERMPDNARVAALLRAPLAGTL